MSMSDRIEIKCGKCGAKSVANCTFGYQGDGVMVGEVVEEWEHLEGDEWIGGDPKCPHPEEDIELGETLDRGGL